MNKFKNSSQIKCPNCGIDGTEEWHEYNEWEMPCGPFSVICEIEFNVKSFDNDTVNYEIHYYESQDLDPEWIQCNVCEKRFKIPKKMKFCWSYGD